MKIVFLNILLLLSFAASAQRNPEESLAAQYYQNGEFEKAASVYQQLFDGNRQLYYDPYVTVLFKLKKYDQAEKVIKNMSKAFPQNYNFQVDYGKVLQERGQQEKAFEWYNGLLRKLPENEYAIRELSIAFYRADAYDFSIKTLLQGRKMLNNNSAFAFDLISLYRFQKNKQMLIEEYLNLLSAADVDIQVLNQAKNTFSTLFESAEDYQLLRSPLLKKIQKEPQNTLLTELLAWQYLQVKDFDSALKQTIAIDKRLREDGDRVYDLSLVFLANKAYAPAVEALNYLIAKGQSNQYYIPAKIQVLNARTQLLSSGKPSGAELAGLEKQYLSMLQEFGRNRNTVFAMRQLASLQAFQLNKPRQAQALLEAILKIPALPASVSGLAKLELGDVYILTGEVWEAALIYGQIEKDLPDEPAGQEAKFRNARLSYYQGDFVWAKSQLDVLKSSTSQLIANDALNLSLLIQENTSTLADTNALKKYAKADYLIFSNQTQQALTLLDSISRLFPGNSLADDILMSKARIYLKQDQLKPAVTQLEEIVKNYSFDLWADDALFMLAEIYETKLNDTQKAKAYYEKIISDYPGSFYVSEARKRFRNLRGDNIG